ncbi:(S)-ureidoglycine aminohydrolase [Shouchella shacheensis]|uniref:(S)-ureidoglycine aminohydrolase n=1 Tax=Shouchella shacheensis TaxID=1649580 RepID=UPI00073FF14C|nr:(S)-ureidoglycine aminohydrolase [Shouchella shacheensis]
MGYPTDLLSSRAVIKHGHFALIPPEGRVQNIIPGFENCDLTILASPKLGASFADYIVTLYEGGKTNGFGEENDVETFVFVLEGEIEATDGEQTYTLTNSGYLYCPPEKTLSFKNANNGVSCVFLYKQKHRPLAGKSPWTVSGHADNVAAIDFEDMETVKLKDLLPTDLAFDMNVHILLFYPGASHPFVETHVQEHGAYLLSGEGMYLLDGEWIPVKKEDYIFFGPYCPQAAYAVGREPLAYVYSKDCNRDVALD